MGAEDAEFYRKREAQEMAASDRALDPMTRRLHWEMAQRYAFLAGEADRLSRPVD
jgi:hypothetical protein